MKIYIATPINGRNEKTFREKWLAAKHRVAMLKEIIQDDSHIWDVDGSVVKLSSFDINPQPNKTEADAMACCINSVLEADAIYLDHGWTSSKGCRLEYAAAKIYGKRIYEHDML